MTVALDAVVLVLVLAVLGRAVSVQALPEVLNALDLVVVGALGALLLTGLLFLWGAVRPGVRRPAAPAGVHAALAAQGAGGLARRDDYARRGLFPLWWGLWLLRRVEARYRLALAAPVGLTGAADGAG